MIIDVTQDDLALAFNNRSSHYRNFEKHCPIAEALRRMYPSNTDVRAHPDSCIVYMKSRFVYIRSTQTMREYMRRFDRGKAISPKRFRVQEHVNGY